MIVQIISPGMIWTSGFVARRFAPMCLHQDVAEQTAEEAVEDDGLGEGEAEPHQALELAAQLGLAGDRRDHRAEDEPDAGAGAGGAEADAERQRDRLAGVDDRGVLHGGGDERHESEHASCSPFLSSAPARWPWRFRWR